MKEDNKLKGALAGKGFVVTAEYRPPATAERGAIEKALRSLPELAAVNISDNHHGIGASSLAVAA